MLQEVLLEARNIRKTFATEKQEATILSQVNFTLNRGEFAVIMGPSGAGKSTLLYCLSAMENLTGGEVLYQGKSIHTLKDREMAALRALRFGFVFQQSCLVSHLTLRENIAVTGYLNPSLTQAEADRRAEALMVQMDLKGAAENLPGQVSGGEAQRAAVSRAVMNQPDILFADEPTGALNRKNSEEVLNLMTELHRQGQSVLMVTHDAHAAVRADRIVYLQDGRIMDEKTLPPYQEALSKARETEVLQWLGSMSW